VHVHTSPGGLGPGLFPLAGFARERRRDDDCGDRSDRRHCGSALALRGNDGTRASAVIPAAEAGTQNTGQRGVRAGERAHVAQVAWVPAFSRSPASPASGAGMTIAGTGVIGVIAASRVVRTPG